MHTLKDNVVCPYCGATYLGSDFLYPEQIVDNYQDTYTCDNCGNRFRFLVNVSVKFSTSED